MYTWSIVRIISRNLVISIAFSLYFSFQLKILLFIYLLVIYFIHCLNSLNGALALSLILRYFLIFVITTLRFYELLETISKDENKLRKRITSASLYLITFIMCRIFLLNLSIYYDYFLSKR